MMSSQEELSWITDEHCKLMDNAYLVFGDGTNREDPASYDICLRWDGTDLDVLQGTANSAINFGIDGAGIDLKLFGDTASAYLLWDQSADDLILSGAAGLVLNGTAGLKLGDDVALAFGASDDITIDWNASGGLDILQATVNSAITFGVDGAGIDLKLWGDTASSYMLWDQSGDELIFEGADLRLNDDDHLYFGDSKDVQIYWNTSGTNLLYMLPLADDTIWYIGNGTLSFDIEIAGNSAFSGWGWDASADTCYLEGAAHPNGWNSLPTRYELRWMAGQRGKPGINADIQNAAEAVRMIADPDFEVLGTNASTDDVTFYAEGGVTLETDGADGDEVILLPHLDAGQSAWTQTTWGTDQETAWECWIRTGASITNAIIWAGLKLTNTEVTATDADQVFFRYEDDVNGGEWQAVSSIANVDDEHDTNIVAAINTDYHLKIVILANRTAQMWINGVLAETTAALTNTIDLIPYIGVAADGAAAAKTLYVRGQAISRKFA